MGVHGMIHFAQNCCCWNVDRNGGNRAAVSRRSPRVWEACGQAGGRCDPGVLWAGLQGRCAQRSPRARVQSMGFPCPSRVGRAGSRTLGLRHLVKIHFQALAQITVGEGDELDSLDFGHGLEPDRQEVGLGPGARASETPTHAVRKRPGAGGSPTASPRGSTTDGASPQNSIDVFQAGLGLALLDRPDQGLGTVHHVG